MEENAKFVTIEGVIMSVKSDVIRSGSELSKVVTVAVKADEDTGAVITYEVSFFKDAWENEGFPINPILFSNMVVGNIITISGREYRNGCEPTAKIGLLKATPFYYKDGVVVKSYQKIAQVKRNAGESIVINGFRHVEANVIKQAKQPEATENKPIKSSRRANKFG